MHTQTQWSAWSKAGSDPGNVPCRRTSEPAQAYKHVLYHLLKPYSAMLSACRSPWVSEPPGSNCFRVLDLLIFACKSCCHFIYFFLHCHIYIILLWIGVVFRANSEVCTLNRLCWCLKAWGFWKLDELWIYIALGTHWLPGNTSVYKCVNVVKQTQSHCSPFSCTAPDIPVLQREHHLG